MSLSISLTAEQVEQRLSGLGIPCAFSTEERTRYETTPVVHCAYPLFGFPIPEANSELTLSKIRRQVGSDPAHQPAIFDHPWLEGEAFMETACAPGWHFVSMDVVQDSISQSIDYIRRLEPVGMQLPTAVEVVLMLFLHYAGTKEQLLMKKHTWCSDQASLARHVTVGAFGRNGVFLSGHPAGFASRGLGICAKVSGG